MATPITLDLPNIGTYPNDRSGDTLRQVVTKTNTALEILTDAVNSSAGVRPLTSLQIVNGSLIATYSDGTTENAGSVMSGAVTTTAVPVIIPGYPTITGFGDSVMFGANSTDNATKSYLALVAAALKAAPTNSGFSGTILSNTNLANGAPQAGNGRDRFAVTMLGSAMRAAALIVYGYNDARYTAAPDTVNVASFTKASREMLNGLISGGMAPSTILWGTPYYITDAGLATGSSGYSGQTRAGYEAFVNASIAVAREFGVSLCDLYSYLRDNGYAALVSGDNIHPTDAGMALIAKAILTNTYEANKLPKPTSVAITFSGTTATITASGATGAVSYEYVPVLRHADVAMNASGEFAGVAPGLYYGKARAVFSNGLKGPWAFSAANYLGSAPGVYLQDSTTDAADTPLRNHTPQIGGPYVKKSQGTANEAAISAAGRIYATSAKCVQLVGAPAGPDHWIEADFCRLTTITGEGPALILRADPNEDTYYWARYNIASSVWQMLKNYRGISTAVGSPVAQAFPDGTKRRVRFGVTTVSGNPSLSLLVDGATMIAPVVDTTNPILAVGQPGFRITTATVQTPTTGMQFADLRGES